jgi:LysM repeat protein
MSRRSLILTIIAVVTLFAVLIPLQVRAGGVCGGAYTVEKGDSVDKLAALCGTTSAAIYAANPGLKEPLKAGQVITIPGSNFGVTPPPPTVVVTPMPVTATPVPVVINNYYTYNYYNSYNYYPSTTYSGSYVVQPGDTFSSIAYRFGLTIHELWAANPYIWDINLLYVGQVLYIPSGYWAGGPNPISQETPTELSYPGDIPKNAPHGSVTLVNKSEAEVYISLRTTRADGTNAINEYPVGGKVSASVPVGWIDYVAWVGGRKFTGGFKLSEDSFVTITFNRSKVVVE